MKVANNPNLNCGFLFKQFDLLHVSQDCVSVAVRFCWWCSIPRISSSNGCILFCSILQDFTVICWQTGYHSWTCLAMTSPQPELLATTMFFRRSGFKAWILLTIVMSSGYCDEIRFYFPPNCAVLTGKRTLLAMLLSELPPSCAWNCLPRGVWFWHLLFRFRKCK